uniref:Ribonuclease H-like domain-containing protein n=1 Tax=Tanacetum cinerariifolium TaxID=118510 RepID=A0A6L2MG85_TANCI|nr:ribonuclease H-like domain-containing protein [Tanacetum cinerariifolium]
MSLQVKKPTVETSEAKDSADKPKDVKRNFGPLLIEDWISNSDNESELKSTIEKETVKPSFDKIKFVKSKEQLKSPRKTTVKQDKVVIDIGCSRHMTRNMSYLTNYEEIDGGYVAFGGKTKGGKITRREAVNTDCYVQNKVLVVKPHNKTPYELFHDRTPALSFMRPFRCHVTILNTKDHLRKFDGKADEGFFVGYSLKKSKSSQDDGFQPLSDDGKKVDEDPRHESTNNKLPFDPEMPTLEDISTFNFSSDQDAADEEADERLT